MTNSYTYKGRHRARTPSVSETAGKLAAVGMTASLPLLAATAPAQAATPTANWAPIVRCESGGNNVHTAISGPFTASGYYQITDGTWAANGGLKFARTAMGATYAQQTIVADRIFATRGYSPWKSSRKCWGSEINSPTAVQVRKTVPRVTHAQSTPVRAAISTAAAAPMTSGVVTQGQSAHHLGIDIAAPMGTPEYAAASGTIVSAGPAHGFGLWVRIRIADGTILTYGHMQTMLVHVGQTVSAGQQIATVGSRGDSSGPHLHFQVTAASGSVMNAVDWLASHGVAPVGAVHTTAVAPQPRASLTDTGRDANGYGTYTCDAAHLSFDACDVDNVGQPAKYPHYDRA